MANSNLNSNCAFCNLKSPIFKLLGKEELEYLNETRTEAIFLPGETIIKQGTPVNNVLSFVSGFAKAYIEINTKQKLIVQLYKKQDFIAVPGIYYDNVNHFTITAIENSRICYIDWARFNELLKSNQSLSNAFLEYLNMNHVRTMERLINLNCKQSNGKIADVILYLSENIYNTIKFRLNITNLEIAQMAGISKEGAAKIIKEFTEAEIIVFKNKDLEILNIDRLKEISKKG